MSDVSDEIAKEYPELIASINAEVIAERTTSAIVNKIEDDAL